MKNHGSEEFPSPTGVNHYELYMIGMPTIFLIKFPSPTGVNHYELFMIGMPTIFLIKFPSPTGVNHYEYAYGKTIMDCEFVSVPNRG